MWVLGDVTSSCSQNDSHLTDGDDTFSPQQAALLHSTFTLCTMALYGRTTGHQLVQQQHQQQWRRKEGANEDDSAESHHTADRFVRSEWDDQKAIDVQDLIREAAASNSSCTSSSMSVRLHHRVGCAVLGWLLATMRAAPPLPATTLPVSRLASPLYSNDGCESTVIGNEMKQRARTAVYDALLLLLRTLGGRSAALIGGGGATSNAIDTLHPNPLSYRPVEWIQWRRVLLHSALSDSAKGRSGTNVEGDEEETYLRDVLQCVLVGPSCQWHCLWHRTTDNREHDDKKEGLQSGGGGGDNAAPGEEDPTSSSAGACAAAVVGVQLLQLLTSQIAELTATQEEEDDDDDDDDKERQEADTDLCPSTSTRCRTSLLLDKVYRSLTTQVENPQTAPSGEAREGNEGVDQKKKQSKSLLRCESMIDAIKRGYGSGSGVPRSGGISPRVGTAASSVANARARRQSVVSHDALMKFQTAYCRWQCLPPPHSSSDSTVAMTPRSSSFLRPATTASGRSTTPLSSRPPSARVVGSQYYPPVEDVLSVDTSRATVKDATGTTTPTQPVASEAALTTTTMSSPQSLSSAAESPQPLQHKEERGNSREAQIVPSTLDLLPYRCAPFAKLVQQQEQRQKEDPAAAGLSSLSQCEPICCYDGSLQSATELIAANKQTLNDWMSTEVERWTSRRAVDAVAELRQLTQWAVAISQGGQEESSGVPMPLESLPAEFLHEVATAFRNSHPHSHCATDQTTSSPPSSSEEGLSLLEDMIDLLTERLEERIVLNVA